MKYDKVWRWIVDRLPKRLIYFASVQMGAEVTTGEYSDTDVVDLGLMDAIGRYSKLYSIE